MKMDTRSYIASCPVCAWGKTSTQLSAGLLQPLPIPSRPWSHVAVDLLLVSRHPLVILTVIDRFSKFAHILTLPKLPSAKETADILVAHMFRLLGLTSDIVSDRGPQSLKSGRPVPPWV